MYLISIYFDSNTNKVLNNYIESVANTTANTFMLDNNVPPHITIAGFRTKDEELAIKLYKAIADKFSEGVIDWVTVGLFGQSVVYAAPVLNEYLHKLSIDAYEVLSNIEGIELDNRYLPFNWLPHATIAKTLTKEQQLTAIAILQNRFTVSSGSVVKIGLARTNPFENLYEIYPLDINAK